MQRFMTWLTGASLWALCIGTSATWLPAKDPDAASETEAAIRKALGEKTTFEFVEKPLQDVVEFIAKKHGIQIVLDTKGLEDAGLGPDVPITRTLHNISLRSALKLTLRNLDLTWVIDDEVLQITTVDEAGNRLKPRVYDVTDLVAAEEGGADYDSLIDMITTIIAPTTWDDVGGPGSIAPFPAKPAHAIVIAQTSEIQDQIAQFLSDVRSVRDARKGGGKPAAEAAAQAAPADPNAVSVKIYKIAVPQTAVARTTARSDAKSEKLQDNLPQNVFGNQSGIPNDRYLEELAKAIPALVRPETWEQAGGAGVLHALPPDMNFTGHLLVRQTGEVHAQLQKFLKELQPGNVAGGFGGGGFF